MIAPGDSVLLSAVVSGGVPPYSYGWTPPVGVSTVFEADMVAHPAMTTTYLLTVSDSRGRTVIDEVRVEVGQLVPVEISTAGDGMTGRTLPTNRYVVGTTITIPVPTAPVGFHFVQWSGDASGTSDPLSLVVDGSKKITAVFAADVPDNQTDTGQSLPAGLTGACGVGATPAVALVGLVLFAFAGRRRFAGDATAGRRPSS